MSISMKGITIIRVEFAIDSSRSDIKIIFIRMFNDRENYHEYI